jgi:DNA-binding winged helix-turn-helix (wHTH) protein
VWGYDSTDGSNLVEVAISRLRKKIEKDASRPERLLTVRGIGYRFSSAKSFKTDPLPANTKVQVIAPHTSSLTISESLDGEKVIISY